MKYRIIIRPETEVDLREAFQWYEYKRNGLGYDSVNALRNFAV